MAGMAAAAVAAAGPSAPSTSAPVASHRALIQGRRQGRHRAALPRPGSAPWKAGGTGEEAGRARLSAFTWNVANLTRSKTRELELRMMLDKHRPDIVALSEAELDEEDSSFGIPGYTTFYSSPFQRKIRVLMLLKDSLIRATTPTLLAVSHQEIWIRIACPSGSGSWTLAACYRQWTKTEAVDFSLLCDHVIEFSSSSSRVLLMGDFNLDAARKDDKSYYRRNMLSAFLALLEELGYVLENDTRTPTFRSHGCFQTDEGFLHRESVLDLICSLGTQDERPDVRVLDNAAGDHRPVLASYPLCRKGGTIKEKCCRDFKRVMPGELLMAVNVSKISGVFQETDVEKITEILVQEITAALDLVAPYRPIFVKEGVTPLLLGTETRRTMAARDAAAQRKDWPLYRRLRNLAARQVRQDRVASTLQLLTKHKNDAKQVWKLADSLTGRGKTGSLPPTLQHDGQPVEGDDKLAGVMNTFYISKIDKIRQGIDAERKQQEQQEQRQQQRQQQGKQQQQRQQQEQQQQQRWQQRQQRWQQQQQQHRPEQQGPLSSSSTSSTSASSSSFSFRAPSAWEVRRIIGKLRNTPAVGEDGIPTSVIKDLAEVLAAPLAHLAERSFASGRVPSAFKTANVVPVLKPGKDPALPSSFRPVALLNALSKVLEGVVMSQLSPFLGQRLPAQQWGFRPARSTAGALAAAHGSWCRARAQGKTLAIAAFDFSSAFDTLGVEELMPKLRRLDIGEEAVTWVRNYLSNRLQRVRYGSACSSLRGVFYGVPQGSLLGPLLFTTLTADLPATLTGGDSGSNIGITLYADDTCLWSAHKDPEVARKELQLASSKLMQYALDNSLALNPGKTQLIWTRDPSSITIGKTVVHPQDELLLLGVRFDKRLSIKPYLRALSSSARSLLALTRRLLLHLPRGEQVQNIVSALVTGKLGYGSILLPPRLSPADPSCQLLQQVQTTINDIARLLLGASRADKIMVGELLTSTKLPSLNRLTIKTVLCETWKCLRSCDGPNGGLNPLGEILSGPSPSLPQRGTRSAKAGTLPPPLRIRDDTFVWSAFKLYNEHESIRSAPSYAAARRAAEFVSRAAPI